MDFEKRLEKAIERGRRVNSVREEAQRERALTEQELQRLHSQFRLDLSDQIELCLRQIADRFPGFNFETIVDERGWGAGIRRDDLKLGGGRRINQFSRLEIVIRPFTEYHVLELVGKATAHNREVFNRSHYQPLAEVDPTTFSEMIANWSLEYAELYAAKT
jgi:hypothetical protein